MTWHQDPVLRILGRDPPAMDVPWPTIVASLWKIGCTVTETPGFHLTVELQGRVARFHAAVGTAWSYQLVMLRRFLEEAE